MYESVRKPLTATRKNMGRIMSKQHFDLLRKRNIIENVWSVMKLNYNLVYHRARSVIGMFRHFFYLPCYNSANPRVSLAGTKDFGSYKLYLADTGLFITLMFIDRPAAESELYRILLMRSILQDRATLRKLLRRRFPCTK